MKAHDKYVEYSINQKRIRVTKVTNVTANIDVTLIAYEFLFVFHCN